jgi:hypothetical protein
MLNSSLTSTFSTMACECIESSSNMVASTYIAGVLGLVVLLCYPFLS